MAPPSFGPLLLLPGPKSGSAKADAGIASAPTVTVPTRTLVLGTARRDGSIRADDVYLSLSLVNYALRYARWEVYLRRLGVRLPRSRSLAVFLAVTCIGGGIVDTIVKIAVGRPRPDVDHPIITAFGNGSPSRTRRSTSSVKTAASERRVCESGCLERRVGRDERINAVDPL